MNYEDVSPLYPAKRERLMERLKGFRVKEKKLTFRALLPGPGPKRSYHSSFQFYSNTIRGVIDGARGNFNASVTVFVPSLSGRNRLCGVLWPWNHAS